jgi:hypothetical protein
MVSWALWSIFAPISASFLNRSYRKSQDRKPQSQSSLLSPKVPYLSYSKSRQLGPSQERSVPAQGPPVTLSILLWADSDSAPRKWSHVSASSPTAHCTLTWKPGGRSRLQKTQVSHGQTPFKDPKGQHGWVRGQVRGSKFCRGMSIWKSTGSPRNQTWC